MAKVCPCLAIRSQVRCPVRRKRIHFRTLRWATVIKVRNPKSSAYLPIIDGISDMRSNETRPPNEKGPGEPGPVAGIDPPR
jgi:hypothetical protein